VKGEAKRSERRLSAHEASVIKEAGMKTIIVPLGAVLLAAVANPVSAQLSPEALWAAQAASEYRIVPDVPYVTSGGVESRLDLYLPRNPTGPTPTVLYFHGGFWVRGSKDASMLNILPYLEMGWAAVNVGYRLGGVARAPAAVEDALCALRWVIRNAGEYQLDVARIVVTGHSAGGHLSLATGMIPASAGLDANCAGDEPLSVAAVVNWYGPTDVGAFLDGPHRQNAVVEWLGSGPDRFEVAERVSPLSYARRDLPPILTIHGDADQVVPYSQAERLHEALEAAGARHELHTIPGGGHGGFSMDQTAAIFGTIQRFLSEHGITDG
jgi:acetyl esterase/lipase